MNLDSTEFGFTPGPGVDSGEQLPDFNAGSLEDCLNPNGILGFTENHYDSASRSEGQGDGAASVAESSATDRRYSELEDAEADIQELTELNMRIYRSTSAFMRPFRTPSLDLLSKHGGVIESVRCLMKIIQRVVTHAEQRQQTGQQLPAPESSLSDFESLIRRHSIESKVYKTDICSVSRGVDIATVLMILACHQRLMDTFKDICLSLHTSMTRQTRRYQRVEGHQYVGDGLDSDSLDAQVVMVTELIAHLLTRLDRGQKQLNTALASSGTSSPKNDLFIPTTTEEMTGQTSVSRNDNSGSPDTTKQNTQLQDRKLDSDFQALQTLMRAMAQRQSSLHAHINIIKRSVAELDEV